MGIEQSIYEWVVSGCWLEVSQWDPHEFDLKFSEIDLERLCNGPDIHFYRVGLSSFWDYLSSLCYLIELSRKFIYKSLI